MKRQIGILVSFTVLAVILAPLLVAQANPPAYLTEMPSIDHVLQAMQAGDPAETAARQMGALTQLKNMIEELAGPRFFQRGGMTPQELKLRQDYYTAYYQIAQSKREYGPFTAMRGYDVDPKFRIELIQKCFPASFAAEYPKLVAQAKGQNQALHNQAEQARAQAAAREQADAQKAFAKLQNDYESGKLQASPALQTPEQKALNRCVTAGRPPASCMGNSLLGGFTQVVSQFLPTLGKQRPPGPTMSGVFVGAGNWRIDFITDGVLVNCASLSPNQQNYTVEFKNGRALVVIDTTPRPLVLTLTAEGNLVGPGPIVIDGVVASGSTGGGSTPGHYESKQVMVYSPLPDGSYSHTPDGTVGHTVTESTYVGGVNTPPQTVFSPRRATCPALNLSSKGAGVGVETMETNLLKMAVGADQGPPIPPGLRMQGMYAAKTGFNVEFFPESAIVACGEPARAYPYQLVANGSQTSIKIEDPSHPLLLSFGSDGTLDPGSGSYLVHGRRIAGQDTNGDFSFSPLEATCNLGVLIPGVTPGAVSSAPVTVSAAPAASGTVRNAGAVTNPSMAVPGQPTGNAVLSIVSGFPSAPGGANVLAGAPLILLRDTLSNIFAKAGIGMPAGMSPQMAIASACRQRGSECQAINQAVSANAAAVARAASSGNGEFPGVPPGTYYLMISSHTQPLYWDLKVGLQPGANSITLDGNNAKRPSALSAGANDVARPEPRPAESPSAPTAGTAAGSADAYAEQGAKLYAAEKYDLAMDAYKKALALNPSLEAGYLGLGKVYNEVKQYDKALPPLQRAVRLQPNDGDAWRELGLALFFCKKLGFSLVFSYGSPPYHAQVGRGGARLNLRSVDRPLIESMARNREELLSASMTVATADEIKLLFLEFQSAGVPFQQKLKRQPWGARNFIVKDPDGNLLLFAGPVG